MKKLKRAKRWICISSRAAPASLDFKQAISKLREDTAGHGSRQG
jgi:hypothetical protein